MARRLAPTAFALCVCALLSLAGPTLARAATWTEGTASRRFGLADSGGLIVTTDTADPALVVPYSAGTAFAGAAIEFEPRSIHLLDDGSMLVATGKHGTVLHISKDGRVLRQYTSADIPGLERPFDAVPMSGDRMLVVDRGLAQGEGRVLLVDSSGTELWHYGGTSGLGAGQVYDPFTAQPLSGNRTLIADSLGFRVIEIDNASGAILWSYGTFKVEGPGPGLLVRPHSAERLSGGNTLICDSELHKVIEVTPAKSIVWSYGTGTAGSGPGQLDSPNSATRLASGNTLICDSGNARVIEVDPAGRIVQSFGSAGRTPPGGSLVDPRTAMRLADGSTLIADTGNMRLATYRYPSHREFIAVSSSIDPQSGARKRFVRVRVNASVPAGSLLAVEYSINSGAWTDLYGTSLPSDALGTNIRYRLRVTTGSGDAAPVVRDVSIEWVVAGASSSSSSGNGTTHHTTATGGTGSGTGSGSGSGNGSGSGTATSTAPGGTTTLPGGTAGGSVGSGGVAVTQSSSVSGWVMSEVKDDVTGFGADGTSGPGRGRPSNDSTAPGIAILLAIYAAGLVWSPSARLTSTVVARIVAATMSR